MKRSLLIITCLLLGGIGTYLGQSVLQGQATQPATPPAIPKELTTYRDIVKKVLPAVVSIESQAKGARRQEDMVAPGDLRRFFDLPGLQNPLDDETPAPVGFGSGFLMNSTGTVVTNNHVVEGADQVTVRLASGKKFTSRKIRTDAKTDLAIIQLDTKEALPYLEFGDSETMEIGDRVLAVGAPFRLTGTVTHGIVSSKGRALRMNMYEDFLQTDAAINPGNSGGPLVNLEGKVIGINSAIKSRSGGFQGIGLAISSNLGKKIVGQLSKDGVVRRGYLGVGIRDVDDELAKEFGLKETTGVVVTRIYPEAPGDKAGLQRNDVILRLGGKEIRDGRELQTVVAGLPLGKQAEIEILRDKKTKTLKVKIEEQPKLFGTSRAPTVPEPGRGAVVIAKIGIVAADLTPELAEALRYDQSVRGALITQVGRSSLAAQGGIRPGMVVQGVDGIVIKTVRALVEAIGKASTSKGIELTVRGPQTLAKKVVLQADQE